MKIYNREKYIKNKQLNEIIKILGKEYIPRNIVIFENRLQNLSYNIRQIFKPTELSYFLFVNELKGDLLSFYNPFTDTIRICVFASEEKSVEDIQADIIYYLIFALRQRHYYNDRVKSDNIKLSVSSYFEIEDALSTLERIVNDYLDLIDKFTEDFMNNNTEKISDIMDWENEITFED
jgi:hypothetical protein